MKLLSYIVRRLILALPVLIGVTFITFSISWIANEGHMERGYLTERTTPAQRQAIIEQYGFDQPFGLQYLGYLKRLVTLDLGISHAQNDLPVTEVVGRFFPATIELTLAAMVFAIIMGVFLGTLSAIRKDSPVDHVTRFLALAGVSVPIFWLGLILKFAFATPYPVELFSEAGPIAKTFVFLFAATLPVLAGMYLAENLLADATTWRRLATHFVLLALVVAFLFFIGWAFFAALLLMIGGVAYATVALMKLLKAPRIKRRAWGVLAGSLVVGSVALAVSPWAVQGVEAVFGFIPDVPLGGRFSNELVATEGMHPSLTEGPTRLLLIDTLLARDWVAFNDVVQHLMLPGITLGYASLAVIARMMRASMLETLTLDFVRTARAKGLSEQEVIDRHARRNALIPIATIIGLTFGSLLSGAVLTETIFQWPGLGRWSTLAIIESDTNSIMAFTLLVVVIYLVANLLVDIAYSVLDPRVRLS